MAVNTKVFTRTAAATSNTTLYTVSSTTATAVVTNIAVANTATASATFTLNIDTVAILSSVSIAANTTAFFDIKQVIPANSPAKTITGSASATTVTFHISGVEIV
jgi:hypothetical protein